ncbi:MAG: efflux RND transporter periplasmic adaptor subunit [Chitinophagales bacterium]
MTKNILKFSILVLTLVLFSCGAKEDTSLKGKKAEAKKINTEIKELKDKLDALQAEIKNLEGTKEVKKTLVTTLTLEKKPFTAFVEVQGTSQAENNVNITSEMGGLVKAVYVVEGQKVSKGKVLMKLDNSIVASQMAEIETALSLAKDVFEKRKRLWDKNIGSEIEFLQAKNNYNALLDQKRTLGTQLAKANIKSPIAGKVDKVNLKVGELASPGMTAINVVNLNNMKVEVNIPETYLGKVKMGEIVSVEFPTLGKTIDAKVKSVSQSINSNNRTFAVVASIPNKGGFLKPNLLAKVKIKSDQANNVITVPANLVQKSPQGFYVYAVDTASSQAKAKEVIVKIGNSYNGQIVITEGLEPGQRIIDAGFRDVLDGDILEISEK